MCTRVLAGGEVSVNEYANPYVLAVLAALAAAVVCGGFNGFLVAKLKIQPMVATLILFTAGRGISQLVTNGQITYIRVDGYKPVSYTHLMDVSTEWINRKNRETVSR